MHALTLRLSSLLKVVNCTPLPPHVSSGTKSWVELFLRLPVIIGKLKKHACISNYCCRYYGQASMSTLAGSTACMGITIYVLIIIHNLVNSLAWHHCMHVYRYNCLDTTLPYSGLFSRLNISRIANSILVREK